MLRPNVKLDVAVQKVVNSPNVAPSQCNPQLEDGMHASPYEVINDPDLIDHIEQTLKECHLQQYSTNIEKKLIKPAPKFKKGDLVRYLMSKSKFSKKSSLVGSWSKKIYSIHSINKAHSFKPMHMYILSELGTDTPSSNLPPIHENLLKKDLVTNRDTFAMEKY